MSKYFGFQARTVKRRLPRMNRSSLRKEDRARQSREQRPLVGFFEGGLPLSDQTGLEGMRTVGGTIQLPPVQGGYVLDVPAGKEGLLDKVVIGNLIGDPV
jgi:hypothetical protein